MIAVVELAYIGRPLDTLLAIRSCEWILFFSVSLHLVFSIHSFQWVPISFVPRCSSTKK